MEETRAECNGPFALLTVDIKILHRVGIQETQKPPIESVYNEIEFAKFHIIALNLRNY